jgi:hypothetical protein
MSERRTQTNFLETLLFDYCDKHGIDIDTENQDRQALKQEQT